MIKTESEKRAEAVFEVLDGRIGFLDAEESRTYVKAILSIAKRAMDARCGNLFVEDLEIVRALEDKSEAKFVEWLNQ